MKRLSSVTASVIFWSVQRLSWNPSTRDPVAEVAPIAVAPFTVKF